MRLILQTILVALRASPIVATTWLTTILLRATASVLFVLATGQAVSSFQSGQETTTIVVWLGLLFFVFYCLGPLQTELAAVAGDAIVTMLNRVTVEAWLKARDLTELESESVGVQTARTRDLDLALSGPPVSVAISMFSSGLEALCVGLGMSVLVMTHALGLGLAIAAGWTITHWVLRSGVDWGSRDNVSLLLAERRLAYFYRVATHASFAKEVRMFNWRNWIHDEIVDAGKTIADSRRRARKLSSVRLIASACIVAAPYTALVIWLGDQLGLEAIDGGTVTVVLLAAVGASSLAFGSVDSVASDIVNADIAAHSLPQGRARSKDQPPALSLLTPRIDGWNAPRVELKELHYRFPGEGVSALRGVTMTLEPATVNAIVGPNGAGKSTLARVLLGLYDGMGALSVNGTVVTDERIIDWRAGSASVLQGFAHLELPLRDFVAPNGASASDIRDCLRVAGFERTVELDAVLSARYSDGIELSGGQWQRLAIARAVLSIRQGARFVILDEPTSQLDPEAELAVFDNLMQFASGCTLVLISHRFATVRKADRIFVLEGGQVTEMGNHATLMTNRNYYFQTFAAQARRFDA